MLFKHHLCCNHFTVHAAGKTADFLSQVLPALPAIRKLLIRASGLVLEEDEEMAGKKHASSPTWTAALLSAMPAQCIC